MKFPVVFSMLVAVFSFVAGAAQANPAIKPAVDYSADMTIQAGKENGTARIYHSGDADRREMSMAGQKMVLISDAKQMLMIVPGTGMAMRMEVPRDPVSQVYERAEQANFEAVGKETVNGEATTKYRINEPEAQGHVWLTADGILMKADMKGDQGSVLIEVNNVKRGAQDPSLFKAPAGLMIMDMGQMGGMGAIPGMGE